MAQAALSHLACDAIQPSGDLTQEWGVGALGARPVARKVNLALGSMSFGTVGRLS
jgi:hypothetical protein